MKFHSEADMREHLKNKLKEKLPGDKFTVLESKNVDDIVICRQGMNSAIFFLELKLYTGERIGIGDSQGQGFQPEVVKKQPDYLSRHLAWILCDGRSEEPRYLFTDTATISKNIMGGKIGIKYNNIQHAIMKDANLSESNLIEKIREFVEA